LKSNYQSITDSLFQMAAPLFNNIGYQRVHGDCHLGNVLWDRDLPFLVDFDDMSVAPKVQDLWLIMPDKHYSPRLREEFLEAYSSMGEIDMRELRLVEVLRSLRMIHYNAWIAKRWEDQAFKRAFPQYKEESFWDQHYIDIREQMGKIQDTLTCDY
ncbi:MAG: Ser/Thr protein kinase RdoA (MazF antagonist), partial [Thermoproteota archaeon]